MAEEDRNRGRRSVHRWARRRRKTADTVLITSAKRSRLADWRHRRYLYAGLQLARIPLFIAAVAIYGWLHNPALAAAVAVISLPLPWVAVLLANDAGEAQDKGAPKVYKPALLREQRARDMRALTGPADRPALDARDSSRAGGPGNRFPVVIDADDISPPDHIPDNDDTQEPHRQ